MSRQPSQPPMIAEWLLRHLTSRRNRDALCGDLLESFQQSPSTAWYWRQVLIAILVEASGKLRVRSPQIVIACASTLLLHLSPWIGQMSFVRFLWGRGLALPWPASGAYEFALGGLTNTLILLPFLVFMLRIRLQFAWGRMLELLALSFLLLAIADWILTWWITEYHARLSRGWLTLAAEEAHYFFPVLLVAATSRWRQPVHR